MKDEGELERRLRAMPGLEGEQEELDLPFQEEEEEEPDSGDEDLFPDEEEDRLFDSDTAAGYEGQGSD